MDEAQLLDRFSAAQAIVREAGDLAMEYFRNRDSLVFESKGPQDVVSEADRAKVKAVGVDGMEPTQENISSGAYLISRPLQLVTKGLPKGDVKEFISFMLSEKGQSYVAKNFVPVRK